MGKSFGKPSVLTIGERTFVPGWNEIEFTDPTSTYDFDVVIWDPNRFVPADPNNFGQPNVAQILSAITRRRREFELFLSHGGVIIVFVNPEVRIPLSTAGYFEESDMRGGWDAFPHEKPELCAAGGAFTQILGRSRVSDFLRHHQLLVQYSATIGTMSESTIIATAGKVTSEVVGSMIDYPTGGRLVLLPEMDREFWINGDGFAEPDSEATEAFYASLVEACLLASQDVAPGWVSEVLTRAEIELTAKVQSAESDLELARKKLKSLEPERANIDADKLLLYGTGDALAEQCASILERFGAVRLESARGRADLRFEYAGRILVVEVKGLGKSSREENAAQLEKWVMEDVQSGTKFGVIKPILLINTYRLTPPPQRAESFPSQMIPMSVGRNHALVTTVQLFVMAADVAEGRMRPDDAMSTLISTVGRLDGFTVESLHQRSI